MSTSDEAHHERRKAAAWAWYQRGASGSSAQPSGALLKRRRRRNTFNLTEEASMAARPLPSRFKREAAAALYDDGLTLPLPAVPADHQLSHAAALFLRLHDDQQSNHSHVAAAATPSTTPPHVLQNQSVDLVSCNCSLQSSTAACPNCIPLRTSALGLGPVMPAAVDHCAGDCDWMSLVPRRKSASSPPAHPAHTSWSDKLFGISSSRKSFSGDSSSGVSSPDHEWHGSLMSITGSWSDNANGEDATIAGAAFPSLDATSSLLDSFELCAVLKKLGFYAGPHDLNLEELDLSAVEKERRPVLRDDHYGFLPVRPVHRKQSLYDLLEWSERGLDKRGCRCTMNEEEICSSDHDYHESPEIINTASCGGDVRSTANAAAHHVRQHKRPHPTLSMPNLSHSFSHAFHHLPHFSHTLSNALVHFTHSLSAAYRNLHVHSRHRSAEEGIPPHLHSDDAPSNGHSAASPHHHAHTHRYLFPSSLRHFLSFKWHHSPLHPSCDSAFISVSSPAAKGCSNDTIILAEHHRKASPLFEQPLSKPEDYMLIYSSVKKHSDYGINLQHHYHHHYHHYHYIL